MTTQEVDDALQNCPAGEQWMCQLIGIIIEMNGNIARLEKRLADAESSNQRTANIASCLANGIQPD